MATRRLWCPFTRLHGVVFQNMGIFMFSALEIPKSQPVSINYIYCKYFSVRFVKPMKYFKECRAKECMEVCFYDGVGRMWMSSRAFSNSRHSKEAGEEVYTLDIYLIT